METTDIVIPKGITKRQNKDGTTLYRVDTCINGKRVKSPNGTLEYAIKELEKYSGLRKPKQAKNQHTKVDNDIEHILPEEGAETETTTELELFRELEKAILKLPFGECTALPWCRESFPELEKALERLKKFREGLKNIVNKIKA